MADLIKLSFRTWPLLVASVVSRTWAGSEQQRRPFLLMRIQPSPLKGRFGGVTAARVSSSSSPAHVSPRIPRLERSQDQDEGLRKKRQPQPLLRLARATEEAEGIRGPLARRRRVSIIVYLSFRPCQAAPRLPRRDSIDRQPHHTPTGMKRLLLANRPGRLLPLAAAAASRAQQAKVRGV